MHRYKTSTPRAALAIAAATMTAITIGLTVVAPAKMNSGSHEARTLATAAAVVTSPCVDVDANREPKLDPVQVRNSHPKRKQQG